MCGIERVNGKDLSTIERGMVVGAFEQGMVVGARRTGLCQELQCCWVYHTQQFPVCIKNGPPPKGHPANCGKHWSQHGPASLWNAFHTLQSKPQRIEIVLIAKGGATQYQEDVPNVLYI